MFKNDFARGFLNLHIQKYQRTLFAHFRAGILPLHVETGHFRNLPLEQRLCVLCDKSDVEDEYHFLCQCAVSSDLRRKLYSTTIDLYPELEDMDDLEKFVFLNSNFQKHVIVFITSTVLRRRRLLFHWGDLVLACALVYMYTCVWFVTYQPNGAGWWLLNCMLYLYNDITCHVNKDYVVSCRVVSCRVVPCRAMLCYRWFGTGITSLQSRIWYQFHTPDALWFYYTASMQELRMLRMQWKYKILVWMKIF